MSGDRTSAIRLPGSANQRVGSGGFRAVILRPGLVLGPTDSGLGTLGRIDRATAAPGTLIAMHAHRDDEILTYLRSGVVEHVDTLGRTERITPSRLMLMNAGREFQHEERVASDGGPLEALQVFLRPSVAGLEPRVQVHDFGTAVSDGR